MRPWRPTSLSVSGAYVIAHDTAVCAELAELIEEDAVFEHPLAPATCAGTPHAEVSLFTLPFRRPIWLN